MVIPFVTAYLPMTSKHLAQVRVNALKRAQAQVADAEQRALQEEMLGDGQTKWMFWMGNLVDLW